MKTHTWTVNEQTGEVTKVSPLSIGLSPLEVQAPTKDAAIALILKRAARQAKAGGARLFVRNGAYCLAQHNGDGWTAEAGTLHPRKALACDGSQFSLESGGQRATLREAVEGSSLAYYGSEAFQEDERRTYGALFTVEAETVATLKELTRAVGQVPASQAAEQGLVMPHAQAVALLGKLTGSPVPHGQDRNPRAEGCPSLFGSLPDMLTAKTTADRSYDREFPPLPSAGQRERDMQDPSETSLVYREAHSSAQDDVPAMDRAEDY